MNLTFISLSPDDLRELLREEIQKAVGRPGTSPVAQPKYLSIDQAVQRHGVSKSFLYRLSSERTISTRRVGRSIQFDASELEAHFNSTTKKSQTAIDAELKKTGIFPTLKGKRHA